SSRSSTATSTSSSPRTCGPGTSTRPSATGRPSVSRRTRAICGWPTPASRGGGAPAATRVRAPPPRGVITPPTPEGGGPPRAKPWGRGSGVDADRSRRRQGRNYALNQQRWRPYAERGWTSKVQLEAMDIEGIDVAVVYPSRGLYALTVPDMDPRLGAALARAYNDW